MEYSGERFLPNICQGEMAIEHTQRYEYACKMAKDKVVLDAACGEGYGSSLIANEATKVFGLDISEETVELANEKYGTDKLSFICGSIDCLPFEDASIDMVVSFETIEHVDEKLQLAFLKEIKRVLRPDGIVIISTPNKAIYTDLVEGENKFHVKEFYVEEFLHFLEQEFIVQEVLYQYPDVGYFLARENQHLTVEYKTPPALRSRYVVAICSIKEPAIPEDFSNCTMFSDDMYYSLNRDCHVLDRKVIQVKLEAEGFQQHLQEDIKNLQEEIQRKENHIHRLESDIAVWNEKLAKHKVAARILK